MKKGNLVGTVVGIALSVGLLFGTVWVISKAWQAGQKKATA
jgi:hypothetical protein